MLEYFGYVMLNAKYQLLHISVIIHDKIEGKRRPWNRKTTWLKNLRQWLNESKKLSLQKDSG